MITGDFIIEKFVLVIGCEIVEISHDICSFLICSKFFKKKNIYTFFKFAHKIRPLCVSLKKVCLWKKMIDDVINQIQKQKKNS